MRAAIFRNGDFVVDTIADPTPGEGQVLVKTVCCGICGTDLHAAKHTQQFVERSRRTGGRLPMDAMRDVVFGHEFCCEIVEHGTGTEKRLKPGTLVCSMPMTISGTTVQGIGYSNDVAGGFAQYMPLAERLLLEVPNGLPADKAALGLSVIAGLTIRNVHPIIAADFSPARRALALRMGADVVIDPAATSPYQSWHDVATPAGYDGSRYAQLFGSGPKLRPAVIFECVGVPGVIQQIIDGAPAGARIVVVGVCMETDRFEPFFGIIKQINLQFVLAYTGEEFAASLRNIAEGKVDVTPLITGHVGLEGVKGAFTDLASPEQHAKIMVQPWE